MTGKDKRVKNLNRSLERMTEEAEQDRLDAWLLQSKADPLKACIVDMTQALENWEMKLCAVESSRHDSVNRNQAAEVEFQGIRAEVVWLRSEIALAKAANKVLEEESEV